MQVEDLFRFRQKRNYFKNKERLPRYKNYGKSKGTTAG